MQRLGDMLHQLARYRSQWESLTQTSTFGSSFEPPPTSSSRLVETTDFGANPGNLRMFSYVPPEVAASPALVVVLHGCTQNAAGYDYGSGWSVLAEEYGFIVVYPEQQEANNIKRCFNWFQVQDIERDRGEAHSIRQMVARAVRDHGVDPKKVFVTGLSAGGAMTATMLATYPDVFAGGAIIAGLPYRSATTVAEAFESMFQGPSRPAEEWGDLVRRASTHRGPWPKVSVWHGSADATVRPMNAGEIIKQWTNVHGLKAKPDRKETVDGYPRRVWTNADGEAVIEEYTITGMAHGTPVATGGENSYGAAGPFLLEVGISSSYRVAQFWGLTSAGRKVRQKPQAEPIPKAEARPKQPEVEILPPEEETVSARAETHKGRRHSAMPDVGAVINKALRAAGLMR
ncbi:PHB depolymerase family esterase [Microvirga sp. 2YAF29]|uniref:extracellular catalytic domain type 1 short-chain-length polyhydroxyalkanoate depolymerase n=1 Tax=Microvirga sp. 2YAF29 TaxID=3233031 RepID=UPI003F97D507